MAEASITVAVRVRPFSPKEASQLAPDDGVLPFLGDGGLGGQPIRPSIPTGGGAMALRTRFLRPIIHTVDDKVLIFDPPDNNALTRMFGTQAGYMAHGQKKAKDVRYAFDRVFDSQCGQQDIFEGTTKPLLDGVLNGFNATVFAYGATGCGKTHTISGSEEDPGVIFLTMKELYRRIEDNAAEQEVNVSLSYLEIYNETIRDLLSDEPTPRGQGLMLREDNANKISVAGIEEKQPTSPADVLQMIQDGNKRRTMSPTEANAVSSRSHAVLQINVTSRPRTGDVVDETTSASLNIIDLAGSERAAATRNCGARMQEGANINKSLLALGNCINALCQSGMRGKHIPYRNSKLTRLLKFSLGGNCKTVMIVCVSPSSTHYDETLNTLKYANQAKNIRTKVSRNITNVDRHVAQYVQTIHELREEIRELKAKLSDQGAAETDRDRKLNAESRNELSEATNKLKRKAEEVKGQITTNRSQQGHLQAAEIMRATYQKRLNQLGDQLKMWSGRASPGEEEPTDLTAERELLTRLCQMEDDRILVLRSGEMRTQNAVNLFFSQVASALRNSKLVAEDLEQLQASGSSLKAEVEATVAKAGLGGMSEQLESQTTQAMTWLGTCCWSTVSMKEIAGELIWRADHREEDPATEGSHLRDLAQQLRSQAQKNDEAFQTNAGGCTADPSVARPRRRPLVVRRPVAHARKARPSVSSPARPGADRAAKSRTSTAPGMKRRLSTVPAAATHSPSRLAAASPRRPTRRPSVTRPVRSGTTAGLQPNVKARPSTAASGALPNSRQVAAEIAPARKNLRWADDISGGQLDDAERKAAVGKALEPRRSTTPPWSPRVVQKKEPAEWEDVPGRVSPEVLAQRRRNDSTNPGVSAPSGPTRSLFGVIKSRPSTSASSHPLRQQSRLMTDSSDTVGFSSDGGEFQSDDPNCRRAVPRSDSSVQAAHQPKPRPSTLMAPTAASRARSASTNVSETLALTALPSSANFAVDENTSIAQRPAPYPSRRRDSNIGPNRASRARVSSQFGRGFDPRGPIGTSGFGPANRSRSAAFPSADAENSFVDATITPSLFAGQGVPAKRRESVTQIRNSNTGDGPMRHVSGPVIGTARPRPSNAPGPTSMFHRQEMDAPALFKKAGVDNNPPSSGGITRHPPGNTAARVRASKDPLTSSLSSNLNNKVGNPTNNHSRQPSSSSSGYSSRTTSPVMGFTSNNALRS
ncbi:unnamed protein product [Sympodiomycopsis kandeliae]